MNLSGSREGIIFILSSPSGGGKSTLANAIASQDNRFRRPVSYTTRRPRPGEKSGKDYRFISEDQFLELSRQGVFLEEAVVHGARYATPENEIKKILRGRRHALLTIDTQGARSVRKIYGAKAVSIFLLPPNRATLRERLRRRHEPDLDRRLANAANEIAQIPRYDFCLINDILDCALLDFFAIARAEELRRLKNTVSHNGKFNVLKKNKGG